MNFLSNLNLNKNELQNAVMHPLASPPSSPKAGQVYFNSVEKEMYQYDGTKWKKFGSDSIDWSKITNIPDDLVFDENYVHTDNNFTTTEKNKLSGIQSGAEVNVQADWNETSSTSDAYIKNKPTIPTVPVYTIEEVSVTSGYLKTYQLKKDSTYVGAKINIPKDMVVSSGSVKTVTQTDVPYSGAVIGDKYIDLVIANATSSHIYIPVKDLVDVYTAGTSISVSNSNVISVVSDTALSSTSVNPVQNKVINTALAGKLGKTENAVSATKLATARNINGLNFDGTANRVNYGICNTEATTAAKVVSCSGFSLITGSEITVKFTVTNTASNPTLNVNSTGAKAIYYNGSAISAGYLKANKTYNFRYNGTQYDLVGDIDTNTTYTLASFGITATASELNKLDGCTVSTTELNYLDGVTSNIQTQLGGKLGTSGNASNVTNTFTQASSRANLTSGEKLSISLGKIMKWFADLKTVAFSGSYNDLTNKPTSLPANGGNADTVDNVHVDNSSTGNALWTAEKIMSQIESSKSIGYQYTGTVEANEIINMTIPSITDYKTPNVEVLVFIDEVWQKAIHGIDYVYAFTSNTNLKVTFFNAGQYKVNYFFMASGSFPNFITSETQPTTQNQGDYWFEIL